MAWMARLIERPCTSRYSQLCPVSLSCYWTPLLDLAGPSQDVTDANFSDLWWWYKLAAHYRGNRNEIFELMNEHK
ncbi:hypothetical protein FE257_003834 [Aspergillus nanangensis]|uniref:Uncharacterized protein n=1 Tax=Aspergillus nanangensis TaxID=2582783 RepID=A0AAD4GNB9_ASPNN|nr:hypothetical protein FE257_003834 [Aspergillus nanangensis]